MEKCIVSSNKSKLDINLVHSFLTKTNWAKGRTLAEVKKTVTNSDCYGIYIDDRQIGFARIVTDYTAFAYLMDVFIIEPFRGKGYSKKLLTSIFEDSKYMNVKKWLLATTDAHGLYQKFGFKPLESPENIMQKAKPNDT